MIWGWFFEDFWIMFWSFWDDLLMIFGFCWDHLGMILGWLLGHPGVTFGWFWDKFRILLGHIFGHPGVTFPTCSDMFRNFEDFEKFEKNENSENSKTFPWCSSEHKSLCRYKIDMAVYLQSASRAPTGLTTPEECRLYHKKHTHTSWPQNWFKSSPGLRPKACQISSLSVDSILEFSFVRAKACSLGALDPGTVGPGECRGLLFRTFFGSELLKAFWGDLSARKQI